MRKDLALTSQCSSNSHQLLKNATNKKTKKNVWEPFKPKKVTYIRPSANGSNLKNHLLPGKLALTCSCSTLTVQLEIHAELLVMTEILAISMMAASGTNVTLTSELVLMLEPILTNISAQLRRIHTASKLMDLRTQVNATRKRSRPSSVSQQMRKTSRSERLLRLA